MTKGNILTDFSYKIDFCQLNNDSIPSAIENLIQEAQARLDKISEINTKRTFENTILAFDRACESLDYAMSILHHTDNVNSSESYRQVYNSVIEPTSKFYSSIYLRSDLYTAFSEYAESDEAKNLEGEKKRFLKKTLEEFKKNGAALSSDKKERLKEIRVELSMQTTLFSQNVVESSNAYELIITDESRLAGLPTSAKEAARESAIKKGKQGYRFTLQAPSFIPVMEHADDAKLREELYRAFNLQAKDKNPPLIQSILKLRAELAQLLGFENFADYATSDRMAKSGRAALKFIEDLAAKVRPHFEKEKLELENYRKKKEGNNCPDIQPWDVAYYAEKLREEQYQFNDEELRPYFEFNACLRGAFAVANKLFGVCIEEVFDLPVWHADVKTFAMRDRQAKLLGYFYTDFFPREEKRAGAWMEGLVSGVKNHPIRKLQVGFIAGNFTPPTSERPALLTHDEVQTLFHEFGHLLHHMLSSCEMLSLAGTNVAWDFVELPSQIMENWCWEKEVLLSFAKHYQNGSPLPDHLFDAMARAKNFRSASFFMRQLGFGITDLRLHSVYNRDRDVAAVDYARMILNEFAHCPAPAENVSLASFTHLFSGAMGYAAGYYSYKWAEVLDADAYSRFQKEGILNSETGQDFVDKILSRGASEEAEILFRNFMGRDPDPSALLTRSGIS